MSSSKQGRSSCSGLAQIQQPDLRKKTTNYVNYFIAKNYKGKKRILTFQALSSNVVLTFQLP